MGYDDMYHFLYIIQKKIERQNQFDECDTKDVGVKKIKFVTDFAVLMHVDTCTIISCIDGVITITTSTPTFPIGKRAVLCVVNQSNEMLSTVTSKMRRTCWKFKSFEGY